MRVFFMVSLFLMSGIFNSLGSADDTKPYDLTLSKAPSDDYSADLTQMHDFVKSQQEKQQKIDLLTLDLDEAKIELELRQKKVALGHYMDSAAYPPLGGPTAGKSGEGKLRAVVENDSDPEVKSIFITNTSKEAVLVADGSELTVKEGDNLGGVKVKAIDSKGVTLVRANNEEFRILLK